MDAAFLVSAVLFVVCLAIRGGYERLKEAKRLDPESKPIFATILTVMCALWVSWFALCPRDPVRVALPGPVRWTALAVVLVGMFLAFGALVQLRGVENIDHLVTGGLFRRMRHPMYCGFVAWLLGWSVFWGAAVGLALGVVGIGSVRWWARLEDARLVRQFGSAYEAYRRTTWW